MLDGALAHREARTPSIDLSGPRRPSIAVAPSGVPFLVIPGSGGVRKLRWAALGNPTGKEQGCVEDVASLWLALATVNGERQIIAAVAQALIDALAREWS